MGGKEAGNKIGKEVSNCREWSYKVSSDIIPVPILRDLCLLGTTHLCSGGQICVKVEIMYMYQVPEFPEISVL